MAQTQRLAGACEAGRFFWRGCYRVQFKEEPSGALARLSPAARTGARLLRAATRACTTSVGPPVNHADPPHVATSLVGSGPSTPFVVIEVLAVLNLLSCILPEGKPAASWLLLPLSSYFVFCSVL
jgi:hypothetical protein